MNRILIGLLITVSACAGQGIRPAHLGASRRAAAAAGCATTRDTVAVTTDVNINWRWETKHAFRFTSTATYTACSVRLDNLYKLGAPTGAGVTLSIWTTNGAATSLPLAQIGSASGEIALATITTSTNSYTFTGMSASVTNARSYWVVVSAATGTDTDRLELKTLSSGGTMAIYDGATWNNSSGYRSAWQIYSE